MIRMVQPLTADLTLDGEITDVGCQCLLKLMDIPTCARYDLQCAALWIDTRFTLDGVRQRREAHRRELRDGDHG